jgi:Integrase core domain
MDEVLWFLGECWKDRGRPEQMQLDNARALAGWGLAARTRSRVIRLCLRFGVSPVFIPEGEPHCNCSVENFNGRLQEPLFQRRFRRPGDLRRELARLQEAVNTQHVHPRLQGQTPGQHRRGLRLLKLPARFVVPAGKLPLAEGRVAFIRRVSLAGTVTVPSQKFRIGKRHRGFYLRLVVDTRRGCHVGHGRADLLHGLLQLFGRGAQLGSPVFPFPRFAQVDLRPILWTTLVRIIRDGQNFRLCGCSRDKMARRPGRPLAHRLLMNSSTSFSAWSFV